MTTQSLPGPRAARQGAGLLVLMAAALLPWSARSAGAPDSDALLQSQRQAMLALAAFDGYWSGPAKVTLADGRTVTITQTERVGTLLDGTIRLIEGRGTAAADALVFNAFAVISWSPREQRYNFRSHAQGHAGDFPVEILPDGFAWSIAAGPATIRYTATLKDGVWSEVGERLAAGAPPVRIFEMTLRRIGDAGWSRDNVPALAGSKRQ